MSEVYVEDSLGEDEYGHCWEMGWEESELPHPGFGGSIDICGGYVDQCAKCGMYGYEFNKQSCGEIIRIINNGECDGR